MDEYDDLVDCQSDFDQICDDDYYDSLEGHPDDFPDDDDDFPEFADSGY